MSTDKINKIGDIFKNQKRVKPPAYEWQDLALRIIKELGIPADKRSAVFKACKMHHKMFIEQCLNDTKELAEKEKWRYFFKLVNQQNSKNPLE